MKAWGLTVQLLGLGIAIGALFWELASMRHPVEVPKLSKTKQLLRRPNPWNPGKFDRVRGALTIGIPKDRDAAILSARIAQVVDKDRERARVAWDAQSKILDSLNEANQAVLQSQLELMAGLHRSTRVRVFIEVVGLLLATVGTVLSSTAS
jgi:hypothetical protein